MVQGYRRIPPLLLLQAQTNEKRKSFVFSGEQLAAAADNNRKKDARLLYIVALASSRFAALFELRTFMASKRDDFFAMDVICHGRGRDSNKETRTTFLRSKNAKREDIKKRIDRVR